MIDGPKMFNVKNATISQEGRLFEGSGRAPSMAAETASRARNAPNHAIAWRGPGDEERAPATVAKSKAARHNALDAGFGFFAEPGGKHRGGATLGSTAAWLHALFPLWPCRAPLLYALLDWRHSRTARPVNGEPPRDARIGGSGYRRRNSGG